jgi:hypothetical protein
MENVYIRIRRCSIVIPMLSPEETRMRALADQVWTDEEHLRWYQEEMKELSDEIDLYLDGKGDLKKMIEEHEDVILIGHQYEYILAKLIGREEYALQKESVYAAKLQRTINRVAAKLRGEKIDRDKRAESTAGRPKL